jgi:hypothetical protein
VDGSDSRRAAPAGPPAGQRAPARARWRPEDDDTLRLRAKERVPNKVIAVELGRTLGSIELRRFRLGLAETPLGTRKKAGRKPSGKPSKSKRAARKKRTCPTIGGKGALLQAGEKFEGNMPNCALTKPIFKEIVDLVKAGNWRLVAARAAGVNIETFKTWIDTGEKQIQDILDGTRKAMPLQAQLVMELDRAEGKCHAFHNAKVLKDAKPELRFAWLKARFPKEWAPTTAAIDDKTGEQTEVDVVNLLVSRFQALKDSSR